MSTGSVHLTLPHLVVIDVVRLVSISFFQGLTFKGELALFFIHGVTI